MGRLYSRGYNIFARAQPDLLLLQVSLFEDVLIALACARLDFTPFLLLYLRRPWLRWCSSLGAQLPDWLVYALIRRFVRLAWLRVALVLSVLLFVSTHTSV